MYRCRIPFKLLYYSVWDRRKYRVSTPGHHLCILVIGELTKIVRHIIVLARFAGHIIGLARFVEESSQIVEGLFQMVEHVVLTFNGKAEDRFSAGKIKCRQADSP